MADLGFYCMMQVCYCNYDLWAFFNGIVNEGQSIIESVDVSCLRKGVGGSKVEM